MLQRGLQCDNQVKTFFGLLLPLLVPRARDAPLAKRSPALTPSSLRPARAETCRHFIEFSSFSPLTVAAERVVVPIVRATVPSALGMTKNACKSEVIDISYDPESI